VSHHGARRHYLVQGRRFDRLEDAAGRAVAIGVQTHESIAIQAVYRGRVIETIDVTAHLSIDIQDETTDQPTGESQC